MSYSYNYNTGAGGASNPGNVKVQNVVIGFYKRLGKVVAEFDIRGLDWNTADGNLVTATIRYSSTDYVTQNLTVSDMWKRERIEWEAGKNLNSADLGALSITLRVDDENDSRTDYTHSVDVDLDPNEYKLTLLSPPSFGDDSTPDIIWELEDLFSEQKMSPVVTVGASTANSMTVTFDDDTTVSGLSSGYINLNGVKFSESSLTMNSADAGKAYWKNAKKFTITSPTMSAGDNTFTLALNCTAI
tara:strand:+ start:5194 stop:5925 length:732 start_codon:yes stop_codon:yes gene_type:complete